MTSEIIPAITAAEFADLVCSLDAEVGRVAERAGEQAEILASISAQAHEVAGVLHRDSAGRELLRRSHELRGLVLHALGVLAELQFDAGRMQALAAVRQAMEDAGPGVIR